MDRPFPTICAALSLLTSAVVLPPTPPAYAGSDRNAVIDLSFPVAGATTYSDTYSANRDGGQRRHQGTDLYGVKGQPVHAAVGGRVCFAPGIDGPMPAYGYIVRICTGTTVYSYIHLDNDTPGTDDGAGGHEGAYAPGIREGVTVTRGQLIGFMGDSGNAEDTPPHLHFDIYDTSLVDPAIASPPWRQHYRNPFPSLRAAQARGEGPADGQGGGALRLGHRGAAVAAWQTDLNAAIDAGLSADGAFGPATDAATRRFQTREGLEADGVVGPATRTAMERVRGAPGGAASPVAGAAGSAGTGFPGRLLRLTDPHLRGEDVRAWQQRMRGRGWRGSAGDPLDVDGVFGPDSDRAARLFQAEHGLVVDGIVGRATWDAVFAAG
jgi:peptidoglycan hydrolase-like protein with peptidoglycan-binding domain